MKNTTFILILAFWAASFAFADDSNTESASTSGSNHPFYIGLGAGADLPGSGWDSDYYVGAGANVFVGYQLDKNWAVQLDAEEWFFEGGGSSLYNLRALAVAKYAFSVQGCQPYLLAGPGFVFQTAFPTGDNTGNFDAMAGFGIQVDLGGRSHLFVESKYNFIVSQSSTFTDFPLSAGLWVGL
jgi:hypothetical protein